MKRCDGKYARNPTRNICRACIRRPKIAKENCKKTCKWFILAFIFFTGLKTRGKFKTKCDIFLTCVLAFLIALLFAIFDRFAFPEPGFWILFFYFASSEISTNNYENCPPPKKKNTHQCSQQTKSSHFTKSPSGCGSLITPLASCPHGAQQTIRNSWQPRGGGPVLIASSGFVEVFCDLARVGEMTPYMGLGPSTFGFACKKKWGRHGYWWPSCNVGRFDVLHGKRYKIPMNWTCIAWCCVIPKPTRLRLHRTF